MRYQDEPDYVNYTSDELINFNQSVVSIYHDRSMKRDTYDGEVVFTVEKNDGTLEYNVELTRLFVPHVVLHEEMVCILKQWASIARKYPHNRRNCLISNERTVRGTLFSEEYQFYQELLDSL